MSGYFIPPMQKWHSMRPVILLALLALLGVGCNPKAPLSNTPPPSESPAPQPPKTDAPPAPLGSGLEIRVATTTKTLTLGPKASCTFTLELPQFFATGDGDTRVGTMNRAIHGELLRARVEGAGKPGELYRPEEVQEQFLALCKQGMQESFDIANDSNDWILNWFEENTVEIQRLPHGLVSMSFYTGTYTGGAHPNHWSTHLNFDTNARSVLTIQDLIRDDRTDAFAKAIAARLREAEAQDGEFLFQDARDMFATLEQGTSSTAATAFLDQVELTKIWSISREGLVLEWNTYDIAPYAGGPVIITLPYKNHADLFEPAWLEKLTTLQ